MNRESSVEAFNAYDAMTAKEALAYCATCPLMSEGELILSGCVLDNQSRPHWIEWSQPRGGSSPSLCTESDVAFSSQLEPYRLRNKGVTP